MLRSHLFSSLLLALCWAAGPVQGREGETNPVETQMKAERVAAVAHFVEWPARRFPQADSPLVIGLWNSEEMLRPLRTLLEGRQLRGRRVEVRPLAAREEMLACHLVFISGRENNRMDSLLRALRREGILTVGDSEYFLGRGGVMSLLKTETNYRLQVSAEAVKREHLLVSSRLLQLSVPPSFETASPARRAGVEGEP